MPIHIHTIPHAHTGVLSHTSIQLYTVTHAHTYTYNPTFPYSFDRRLVHSIARAISDEVRAKHNTANEEGKYDYPYGLICWAPVLNV